MFDMLVNKWWVIAVRGVIAILFGLVALVYPGITLTALVFLFGIYALMDGGLALFVGLAPNVPGRFWYVLEGLFGIAAGILAFVYPGVAGLALVYIVGFWAILTGVTEIVAGFELPVSRDWLLALAGLASVVFGVLVFISPGSGALAIVWLIGIYALIFGVTLVAFAIRLQKAGTNLAPGAI
jgi:uncharacterized membrane protein HdeD (DUF308 family)